MLMTKENSSEILRKELKNYRTYAILKRRSEERIKELKNDSKMFDRQERIELEIIRQHMNLTCCIM